MRWVWAAAAALLWPQLTLLGGVRARREPKRPRKPGQHPAAPNATTSSSEGLLGFPKLPEASGPEFTDAHMTWLNFVRRPDDGASKKRCRGQDKKSRGPPGPPGPPGAEVTQEAVLREFQGMLKEATERRSSAPLGPPLPEGTGRWLVSEAFHCRLKGPVLVDKRTLVELQGFQAPAAQGAFLRGSGLSLASGRFTAPVTAIFQFFASLHVDPRELQGRARLRARDTVRVLVCIESLCHRHTSLEAISGLESSGRVFTVHVQGLLQLQLPATLAGHPAAQTPAAMTSRQAPLCGLAPRCLWLLGAVLLMDASARPANHSSARERVGSREENEILPPDHLNGVKLEMDGHLNRDFHQEVFLGKDTDGFEQDAEPRRSRRKLMAIFSKVDLNTDRRISAKEMQRWIMEKTAEHFQEAIAESKAHFRAVDPDGDGHVSWDEYKVKFLASKGHDEREVADKIQNKWDLNVDEETQEVLENLKDRWYQADNPPPDLLLTESEFLSFLHPEHSRGMLQFMVKEIIRDLDQDGDKKLSLSEFISLPVGTVENQQGQDVDDGWVRDRKREFEELIDANRDGIVTAAELEDYMDPMNEFSALNEAKQMIAVADENQNHCLEPEEVLKYSEFFTGSKLVDYARSVHEEF